MFWDVSRIGQASYSAAMALKKYTFHCVLSRLHYNATPGWVLYTL